MPPTGTACTGVSETPGRRSGKFGGRVAGFCSCGASLSEKGALLFESTINLDLRTVGWNARTFLVVFIGIVQQS